MSRVVAYMGSDAERLHAALLDHRDLLATELPGPTAADAVASFGVGFYQGGEVLLQRRPRAPGGTIDLFEAIRELRTDTFLAQVRMGVASKAAKNENTPPFRFRSWIMAHQGTTPAFDRLRDEILKSIPDFLRRNIRGQTDSEHLFHMFLAALHEAGRGFMEDANLRPEHALSALTQALSRLTEIVRKAGAAEDLGAVQVALTNGRSLCVLRRGSWQLWLRQIGAVVDAGRTYDHFRGVMVLSSHDSLPQERGFEEVPDNHAVLVGRELTPRIVRA